MAKCLSIIKDVAGVILAIASVFIAYNMYTLVSKQNDFTVRTVETENAYKSAIRRLNEAQLITALLPSLVNGSQVEKELAIKLIDTLSMPLTPMILSILSDNEQSPGIRRFIRKTMFETQLGNALIAYEIRPVLANLFFLKAAGLADTAIYDQISIELAKELFGQDRPIKAAKKFNEIFNSDQNP